MTRAAFLAILAFVWQTQTPPARASLLGRVVQIGVGAPISGARIVAARVGGPIDDYRTVTTDAGGGFALRDLAPGSYRLYAQRDGFLQAEYGRRPVNSSGTPIGLTAGQTVSDVVITMTPPGVIAGHVFEKDRPVRNVVVRALRAQYTDGERHLNAIDWATTDDRGEYRLFGLPPAVYFVCAVPPARPRIEGDALATPAVPSNANNNQSVVRAPLVADSLPTAAFDHAVYVPTYYPGTTDVGKARAIDVRTGATVWGIDLAVANTATFRISGRIASPSTTVPGPAVLVGVVPVQSGDTRFYERTASTQTTDGRFQLTDVPVGAYHLSAQTVQSRDTQNPLMAASIDVIVVDRDLQDVTLALQRGVTVNGRISVEGREVPPNQKPTAVQLTGGSEQGLLGSSAVLLKPDGTFSIANVTPRDYGLRILPLARPFWIKAVRFGIDDALNAPIHVDGKAQEKQLEIVVSTDTASLDVTAVDGNQRPVARALVVAVPDSARRSRSELFRSANTDAAGHVHIDGMAPGEYRLFATEEIDAGSWQDPEVIRIQEGRGQFVRLREGDTQTFTLRVQQ